MRRRRPNQPSPTSAEPIIVSEAGSGTAAASTDTFNSIQADGPFANLSANDLNPFSVTDFYLITAPAGCSAAVPCSFNLTMNLSSVAAAVRGATNDGFERLIAEHEEIVNGACRRRIIGELSLIHADDARAAPCADLRHRAAEPRRPRRSPATSLPK
jgi:hypothetical protein